MNLQNEVGSAGIAVGVSDGVGEGLCAVTAAGQGFEVGVAGVQRVGVGAVGVQHQRAVSTGESTRRDWAGRYAIGALYVVGEDIASQRQLAF